MLLSFFYYDPVYCVCVCVCGARTQGMARRMYSCHSHRKLYVDMLGTPTLYSGNFIERGSEGSPGAQASVFLRWFRDRLAEIDSKATSSAYRDLDSPNTNGGQVRAGLEYGEL